MRRLPPLLLATVLLLGVINATLAAVTLNSFEGTWSGTQVTLDWVTGSEIDHVAFDIYRSSTDVPIVGGTVDFSQMTKLNSDPIYNPNGSTCQFIGAAYEYVDTPPAGRDTYYYYLKSYSCNGGFEAYGNGNGGLAVTRPGAVTPTPVPTATRTSTATPVPATATNPPTATPPPAAASATVPIAATNTILAATSTLPVPVTVTRAPTVTTAPGQPSPTPVPPRATVPGAAPPTRGAAPPPAGAQPTFALPAVGSTPVSAPPASGPGAATGSDGVPVPPTDPATGSGETTDPATGRGQTAPLSPAEATATVLIAIAAGTPASAVQPGSASSGLAVSVATPSPVAVAPLAGDPTSVDSPTMASQTTPDPLDWLIQALIGLIIVLIIAVGGLLAWTYSRSRS